jgi:prepilin-type N-terminal cleavage/methylation domain-containing protein
MKSYRKLKNAFSLIELSIVILIVGILIAGVTQSSRLINQMKLSSAQSITRSSDVISINDMVFWAETSLENSLTNSSGGFQMDNGGAISSWNDINLRSSNKINLGQSNTNYQPSYKSSGINGLPSISFDGTNDSLFNTSTVPLPYGDKNYTLVVVWRSYRMTSPDGIIVLGQGNNPIVPQQAAVILLWAGTSGFAGWWNSYYPATQVNLNADYVTIVTINNNLANNVSIYINSNTPSTGATGSPAGLTLANQIFCAGGMDSMGTNYAYQGLISEAMVFDRTLKLDEVKSINGYLGKKYGIKIS